MLLKIFSELEEVGGGATTCQSGGSMETFQWRRGWRSGHWGQVCWDEMKGDQIVEGLKPSQRLTLERI